MSRGTRSLLSIAILLAVVASWGLISLIVPACSNEAECDPISPAGLLALYVTGTLGPIAIGLNAELDMSYRAAIFRIRPLARLPVILAALFWTATSLLLHLGELTFLTAVTALVLWRLAYDIRPAAAYATGED